MEEKRELRIPGPVIAGALLALVAVVYFGGYFGLCEKVFYPSIQTFDGRTVEMRHYPSAWIAGMYRPLAAVASMATGKNVIASGPA